MLAVGLITVGALGVGSIGKMMRNQSSFSQVMSTALGIESRIVQALQSRELYDGDSVRKLASGEGLPGKVISVEREGGSLPVAVVGGELLMNAAGGACTGAECALKTHLDISCATGICRAAYRIEFLPRPGTTPPSPFGAAQWPPRPEDFNQVISYDLYRRQNGNSKCAAGEMFVSGINRGDGSVSCVRPASRRLATNEIAKGVEYSAAGNTLEFKYATLKQANCPSRYVMQDLDPASLESSPSGLCVYRYKKELPWMQAWPSGAQGVSGAFCPMEDYEAVGNGACTMSIVTTTNGHCPATCTNADGSTYDCSTYPAPDTAHRIEQSISGPNVSCRLIQTGTQQCGASWQGQVNWSGVCRITVPENQSAAGG